MIILEKAEKLRDIAKKLAYKKGITEQDAWGEANNLLKKYMKNRCTQIEIL